MTDERVQRRLAAVLAADVVGYSRLMSVDEEGTLATLNAVRRETVDPKISEYGGRIVKTTGDGLLVEFPSVVQAMRCAVDVQEVMRERNRPLPESRQIAFRIGITLGDVIVENGDIFGDGVNIAARLEQIASPGGITISHRVYEDVRDRLSIELEDGGEQQLKNISRPVQVWHWTGSTGRKFIRYDARSNGLSHWEIKDLPAKHEANSLAAPGSILLDPAKPPVLPSKPSIAVLPFQNMSGDREQDYFADGMVEDIITALSRFRSLFVIARNSSFAYKDKAVDIRQVGRELGVRYVLEGSVRKAGSHVRISGQLIEAATGAHLWADKFDGTLEHVFELQDTVAAGVVSQIVPQLMLADADQLTRKSSDSWDSYDHYLRGLALVHRRSIETNKQAQAEFEAAIRLDPSFALPYVQAAFCVHNRYWNYLQRYSEDERTEAIRLTTHALELAPNDDTVLGLAAYIIGNMNDEVERGVALADRSLHLNPNLLQAWAIKGYLSVLVGDLVNAREALDQAIRLSPLDKVSLVGALRGYLAASLLTGEDQAAWAKKLLALNPTDVHGLLTLYDAALLTGATEEASSTHRRIVESYPNLRKSLLREMYLRYRRPEHQAMVQAFLNRIDIPE